MLHGVAAAIKGLAKEMPILPVEYCLVQLSPRGHRYHFPEMMAGRKTKEASGNTVAHVRHSNSGERWRVGEVRLGEG